MIKKLLLGLIAICVVMLFYAAWIADYLMISNIAPFLLLSVLIYHFVVDTKKSAILIWVFVPMIIGYFFYILNQYTPQHTTNYAMIGNLFILFSFVFLLVKIVLAKKFQLGLSKFVWLPLVIIAIDGYIIYAYLKLMKSFNLAIDHGSFGMLYPIIKLLLVSCIIIYYVANKNHKATIFVLALSCLFLAEVVEMSQFMFFTNRPMQSLAILDVGLFLIGIYLFYQHFATPKVAISED